MKRSQLDHALAQVAQLHPNRVQQPIVQRMAVKRLTIKLSMKQPGNLIAMKMRDKTKILVQLHINVACFQIDRTMTS